MNPLATEPLQALRERLEQSRRRLQGWRFVRAGLWVAVASAGVYGLVQLLVRLGVWLIPLPTTGLMVLLLLLGGWLGVLLYLQRTTPDLLSMARLAETRFDLKERLSTALEASPPLSPLQAGVYQQLLRDAARHSGQVDPARLVQLGWPRPASYLLGVLFVLGLLQLLPPLAPASSAGTTSKAQAETASSLQRLAQVVRQDAEHKSDPYLQALARSLEQMSADLQKGQLGGETLERELSRTLDRLSQSYGLEPGAMQGQQSPSPGGQKPQGSSASPGANPNPDKAGSASQAPADGPGLQTALKRLASELEARQRRSQTSAKAPAGEAQNLEDCLFVEGGCITPGERQRLEAEIQAQANRVRMAGPEGGSPGGSGDKAGKGSQGALGAKQSLPDKAATQPVALPAQPRPDSLRRISVSAPTQVSGQAAQDGPAQAGGWQYRPETPRPEGLQGLDAPNRSVVSQYFSKEQE